MARTILAVVSIVTVSILSGCLEGKNPPTGIDDGLGALGFLAGPALWDDPQNTPHPLFSWPTLSSPPNATDLPAFWAPIPASPLPDPIQSLSFVARSPGNVTKAGGIALFGSIAVVPGYGAPSAILDLSDPAVPTILSRFDPQEGMSNHRGATIIAYPDGRLVTVISTGKGLDVWNITDPKMPMPLPPIVIPSHKVGVVPGTPIVYNAASGGGGTTNVSNGVAGHSAETGLGTTGIYDLTDPENAIHVQNFTNGFSCHHVYFWNDAAQGKYRAICAGVQYTQIWDIEDPRNPSVIVSVPVHHGVAGTPSGSTYGLGLPAGGTWAFSHFAGLSQDGTVLLVGDENGGGGTPPGCVASANTPAGAASTPVGALWFYDVSNEKDPKVLGWYSPLNDPLVKAAPATSCTAHHGRLVPAEGRDVIAMSFYGAGVVLVDFTNVGIGSLPKVVDQYADHSDTWETWYNQGYLFTGDLVRGVDVLKFN